MLKSACRLLQIPFYRGFFKNRIGPLTSFQVKFYVEYFNKSFSKFHDQTVQINM